MITPKRKDRNLQIILDTGIVAVIRAQSSEQLIHVVKALRDGGVKAIEITMTTPNALDVIHEVSKEYKDDCVIGAGTVLDAETARATMLAGAEYIVSPTLNLDVIKICRRYSTIIVPGAYTPTEILSAWEAGADIVKVFPATSLGASYFKDVLAPLPQVRMSPTGGVDQNSVTDFIKAGAACVAVGGHLVSKKALAEKDWASITSAAASFIQKIKEARQGL